MTTTADLPSWEDDVFTALGFIDDPDPDIAAAVAALIERVGGRIYPSLAPTGVKDDYVVWQEISTGGESEMDGPSGVDHPLIQFTCWSSNRNRARDVRKLIRKILEARHLAGDFKVTATFSNQLFFYEQSTRLHGALLELRFHLDNQDS